ncbi:MAG: aminopeptidase P family protein [Clostridiales bacterium]|nr:aminopeptidase P family protein [Clostridiales bacterium]
MVNNAINTVFKAAGAEALVTVQDDLRFYLTGFQSSFGVVVADGSGATFYTDSRYLEAAQKSLKNSGITVAEYPRGTKLCDLLKGYKSLAVPFDRITANDYNSFVSAGYRLLDSAAAFKSVMAVKTEEEIADIAIACKATDEAFIELLPQIKEGMSENDVAALLEYLMRRHGASGTSFETICAFGANGSVPHHETGSAKLKFGDAILIDFGCKVNGYCSDCTRTFLFGDDKKHGEFKELYEKVLTAHMLVKEQFTAGMTGRQGDAIARDYLKKYDLSKYFSHSLGHGLGINIHESPNLTPTDESVFLNGMVFSDEPGIYIAGKLGIRIEDTVTLSGGKVVSLTDSDKKLIVL